MKLCYVTELSAIIGDKMSYLESLLKSKPDRIVFRAKGLSKMDYEAFLIRLLPLAKEEGVELVVNHHLDLAKKYGAKVQLSINELEDELEGYPFGVSVHSLEDARLAIKKGASWLVFGHLFPTPCKKGLPPREMKEFEAIIRLGVPTYGIGGIKLTRLSLLPEEMAGVCIMRDSMCQKEPRAFTRAWKVALKERFLIEK